MSREYFSARLFFSWNLAHFVESYLANILLVDCEDLQNFLPRFLNMGVYQLQVSILLISSFLINKVYNIQPEREPELKAAPP